MTLWEAAESAYLTKNWKELIATSEQIIQQDPQNRDVALYNISYAFFNMKKYIEAKRALDRIDKPTNDAKLLYKKVMDKLNNTAKKNTDEDRINSDGEIESLKFFKSTVKFLDVIGLKKAKRYLTQNIIHSSKYPKLFKKYKKRVGDATILYGPPGTGKTWLAKAVAGESKANMINVNLKQLINKYVGSTEKNLGVIFTQARTNTPCIIFFDEIDAVGSKRATGGDTMGEGSTLRTLINSLLSEMDGMEKNPAGLFIIATTNRPWDIDAALKRSGRFSNLVYIPPPSFSDRIALLKFYLKGKPVERIRYAKLSFRLAGYSPSDIAYICDMAANKPIQREIESKKRSNITTQDILSTINEFMREGSLKAYFFDVKKELIGRQKVDVIDGKMHTSWESSKIDGGELRLYDRLIKDAIKFTDPRSSNPIRIQRALSVFL